MAQSGLDYQDSDTLSNYTWSLALREEWSFEKCLTQNIFCICVKSYTDLLCLLILLEFSCW